MINTKKAAVALSIFIALLSVTGCSEPPSDAVVASVAETCKAKGMLVRVFVGGTTIVECIESK